jgi:hypothetical protein
MRNIEIEDGLLDCPKYGVIGELRCVDSCKWFVSKEETQIQCKQDEDAESE